ncbi:Uncharacterised protein [uncultured archaeon]|nr:Uncharacterised protein [uncultured archaeon]
MDPVITEDKKETSKRGSKIHLYYMAVMIIVLVAILIVVSVIKENEISGLKKQIDKLNEDNKNLDFKITGFSLKFDSFKNFSESVRDGNVPFWEENGEDMLIARVPLNPYSARKLAETVVSNYSDNFIFKSIIKNGDKWEVLFVCKNSSDTNSSCSEQVVIDEGKKIYSLGK